MNQSYKSTFSDEVFKIISKELGVNGNICEILDKYFELTNKHKKISENEYDSKFKDYRDNDEEETTNHNNKNFNKLAIHRKLQNLNLNHVRMDFDTTSLYASAMGDEKSVYPKMETGVAFKPQMIKRYVEVVNNQTFNQEDNESDILRRKFYNPLDLMFQHLPVKYKVKNIEVIRMRKGYIIVTLPSVDFQEIVKFGGKVVEIYKYVTYRENFKISPFRKVIE